VTSVKVNTSGEQGGSSKGEPGRYVGVNVTLRRVIGLAYRPVQEFIGGPDWINAARFDIEGKVEGTPNQAQMLEMLRSLLADRFRLRVHHETRQKPAYALRMARSDRRLGPQLRPADPRGGFKVGGGAISGAGVTMAQLAAELPVATEGRYVIDRTGLSGTFDVNLTWNADALSPTATSSDSVASIFAAIQEQLGLRLESVTAPIDVIVIDHAERPAAD
jgi:uncharacterized protein (TIGR03435 family)